VSRVGNSPIPLPAGVKFELNGQDLKVTGPKGSLSLKVRPEVGLTVDNGVVTVTRPNEEAQTRAYHGMTRAIVANMVKGVTDGFTRALEIQGVGWRCNMVGESINIQVGYSHPVVVAPPAGITYTVEGTTLILVSGIDRQAVGQAAANLRAIRKPEPYKGKGIRYRDEVVRRKEGKTGGKKKK
jgi:large subunit ribosomal protein L6